MLVNVWAMNVCYHVRSTMGLWCPRRVCVHVRMCESEALLREMKDILKTWTAACVGGLWRLINIEVLFVVFFFLFFGSSCMYEEYLHSLARTITNGQNAGQAQPHPPCLCITRHTSWLHFPVNTNLSICCFGEGSISFSLVSVMMGTWGLVWV